MPCNAARNRAIFDYGWRTNGNPTARFLLRPSHVRSISLAALPIVLSLIAGSCDAIGYLGLGRLFTAHVTGNLVILAAHLLAGGTALIAPMLAVPVFIVALGATRALIAALASAGVSSLRPLLGLQLLLLVCFLAVGVSASPVVDADAPIAVAAGMFGVSAMAVQNALVQFSLPHTPATAAVTTDITRFMMAAGDVWFGSDAATKAAARDRVKRIGAVVLGFVVGVGLGAIGERAIGLHALAIPAALGLVALALGQAAP